MVVGVPFVTAIVGQEGDDESFPGFGVAKKFGRHWVVAVDVVEERCWWWSNGVGGGGGFGVGGHGGVIGAGGVGGVGGAVVGEWL